ncbi:hypothetical protein CGLO_13613 [Colletotrichum gloeosporioides Cg-14]|uniref:Uncharacterized protein n=1 Tax=Colletotrichum gloeosporioides (strain Cg-14) TaxID=1237896 RepID=T0JW93_COLGC|nr:hypothetical protein CGLO_13613 [Colletotrichum gloeosporioides Cg-14]
MFMRNTLSFLFICRNMKCLSIKSRKIQT